MGGSLQIAYFSSAKRVAVRKEVLKRSYPPFCLLSGFTRDLFPAFHSKPNSKLACISFPWPS